MPDYRRFGAMLPAGAAIDESTNRGRRGPARLLAASRSNIRQHRPREPVDYENTRRHTHERRSPVTPIRSAAMCSVGSARSSVRLATTAAGVPILGYLLSPVLRTPADEWIDLGPIEAFPEKQTRLVDFVDPLIAPGTANPTPGGLRASHGTEEFQVFSVNCTHLGCPVSWFPQSGLFLCPCHGGVYYEDGDQPRDRRRADCMASENRVVKGGRLSIRAGRLPTLAGTRLKGVSPCDPHAEQCGGPARPRFGLHSAILPISGLIPCRAAWAGSMSSGSATMSMFILQIITGMCLAVVYVPSANDAYTSLVF